MDRARPAGRAPPRPPVDVPPRPPPPAPGAGTAADRSRRGSSLYEQPVLVVSQRTKLIELTNEYAVFDGDGQQIGAVVQVGQSALQEGDAAGLQPRPVPHPPPRGARRHRSGARADPAGQGREVARAGAAARRSAASVRSCRPTSSARSASTWSRRPAGRRDPGGELASLGLRDHRRRRHRGRPDHQDVGGPGPHPVHHRRPLRRPRALPAARTAGQHGAGLRAHRGHGAEAGRPRLQLTRCGCRTEGAGMVGGVRAGRPVSPGSTR